MRCNALAACSPPFFTSRSYLAPTPCSSRLPPSIARRRAQVPSPTKQGGSFFRCSLSGAETPAHTLSGVLLAHTNWHPKFRRAKHGKAQRAASRPPSSAHSSQRGCSPCRRSVLVCSSPSPYPQPPFAKSPSYASPLCDTSAERRVG